MKFMSPVFVEQDYNAVFEVVELDEVKHRGTIKCTLQDADGKVAIAGTAKLLNAERF
jgi:acyl dehydratase